MSHLKICRICLRTEAKVYKLDRFQLMNYYEEVTALKMNVKDGLPHFFCFECATLLHKFHKFKEKCYRGQKALKEMLWKRDITYEQIYKLDIKSMDLNSSLEILKVSDRVKTFFIDDDERNDEDEQITVENRRNKKLSFSSLVSEYDDEVLADISVMDDCPDDEKPGLIDDDTLDFVSEKSCSPAAIFIDDTHEIKELEKEGVKRMKSEISSTLKKTIAITPRPKKYKFNSTKRHAKFLDANHWEKINLTEEEAVKEFRARAENKTFLSSPYKCTDCFKGFSKKDMLARHAQLRHGEGVNECRFCRMRFKWDCLLRKHMRQHFMKYKCLRCQLICPLENTALLHEDYHNGITKKCIHCNEEFRHMSTYYTHLRTHRSDYICSLCGLSFVSTAGLHQHKKVKHVNHDLESPDDDEEVNTFCAKCDITFETRKAYVEHVFHSAMHVDGIEDELNDEYSVPRKVLSKKEQGKIAKELRKSEMYHDDDDSVIPFKKRMKKFRRLRRKPMDCHQCGKHFETQAACMRHHLAEHPRTSFFPSTERHICEICGASLAPGSVAMHQNMHTRSRVFACDTCGRAFHSSVGLKRHLVTHTGEKPYACNLCDKRFTQSNSMKLHYRTFHLKQPYPKRNRRKKKDEPHTTLEGAEESKSDDSSEESLPEREMPMATGPGIEPVAIHERQLPDENMHYLTLS